MSVDIYGSSGGRRSSDDAASKKYTDGKFLTLSTNLATKVDKGGDTMTGELDMNGQQIKGLQNPTDDDQACNKKYVDQKVNNDSNLTKSYIDVLMHKIAVKNNVGYIPILNSNMDSKHGFKVTTNSERTESKQAFNAFSYKRTEWITNAVNRNFWIQIQCPETIKIWRFALRGKDSGQDCIYKWSLQGRHINEYSTWNAIYTADNERINNVTRYFDVSPTEGYINYRIFVEEAEGQHPGLAYWQLYTLDSIAL